MESRGLSDNEKPSSIGPLYLVTFVHVDVNFRFAEFRSVADALDIRYAFVPTPSSLNHASQGSSTSAASATREQALDTSRVFALVHLANDKEAERLASRVTCIRAIWQHWASACSLKEVQDALNKDEDVRAVWTPWRVESVSWRATLFGHMRRISEEEKRERIESFKDVLDFQGPINLKEPQCEWCYAEEWSPPRVLNVLEDGEGKSSPSTSQQQQRPAYILAKAQANLERPQRQLLLAVHVGRKVVEGGARDLIDRMNVKKRAYIGNTTMESGMSLVQANMALAGPGKLVYDPFAGTGSLLLACSAFGAYVVGSDIDGRMLRGKVHSPDEKIGIVRSATQYGLDKLFVDALTFDVTQHPLRRGALFDAIVADPPYGVRAGAKRLGRRDQGKLRTEPYLMPNGVYSHHRLDYVPPSKPYALDELLSDLFTFAAHMLVPRGRLVFWMPTMIDVEDESGNGIDDEKDANRQSANTQMAELQLPATRDFRLVSHSLQDFNQWGRRLITLEKLDESEKEAEHTLHLPSAPAAHTQSSLGGPGGHDELQRQQTKGKIGRVRATDNPDEFRNRYFNRANEKRDC